MSCRGRPPALFVGLALAALAAGASSAAAQVILRKPGQGPPTLPRTQGQVPRDGPDPDAPYWLTVRVYVTPIEAQRIPPPGQGVHLVLVDSEGRRIGRDPDGDTRYAEIPDATYGPVLNPQPTAPVGPRGLAGNGITLRSPAEGRYELQVIGVERIGYEYIVQAWDRTGRARWTHFGRGGTEPGAVDRYELTYSLALTPPIWITEKRDDAMLTIFLHGVRQGRNEPADVSELVLTDPRGRRTGGSGPSGSTYQEIPRAYYGGASNDGSELGVPAPADGTYTLDVIGTAVGRYSLSFYPSDVTGGSRDAFEFEQIPTRPGAVHRYALRYSRAAGTGSHVYGAFLGANGGGDESNRLLTYAHPTQAETVLPAGQATFPLLILYGVPILPETFRATLNGADITRVFRPAAGGHELVPLKLRAGVNTLTLSVQGRTASGQVAPDTDQLRFIVQ
jgi:hypothetical protein